MYKVTSALGTNWEPNPEVKYFDNVYDADEYVSEIIQERVQWVVDHFQYAITEEELEMIEAEESSLIKMEKCS